VVVIVKALGVFSPVGMGYGIAAVSLVLGIMILPTVGALSKASIEAVDQAYFECAIALGATKEQAVFRVVVPAAKSGIFASLILGVGRALGETMAVVMVAGGRAVIPSSIFASFRTLTANIVMEMEAAGTDLPMGALIATGIVLMVFIMIVNISFTMLMSGKKDRRGLFSFLLGRFRKPIREAESAPENAGVILCPPNDLRENKFRAAIKTVGKKLHTAWKYMRAKISLIGKYFSVICAGIAVISSFAIVLFILIKGLPHLSGQLIFGEYTISGDPTILPAIVATLMLILIAALIAFPLGIFTAIYLVEYTKRGSRRRVTIWRRMRD